MHEQVEPGRPACARRPARARRAGSATGRRAPRRPPATGPASATQLRRSCAAAGTVETSDVRGGGSAAATTPAKVRTSTSGGPGAARPPPASPPARAGVADHEGRRAGSRGRRAPAAPRPRWLRRRGPPPRSGRPSERSRSAAAAPGMSVLCPTRRPSVEHDGVRRPRLRGPVDQLVEQRHHRPLERHRQRQPAPGRVEPVEEPGQPVLGDLDGVVASSPARARRTPPGAAPGTASARSGCRAPRSAGVGTGSTLSSGPSCAQYSCSSRP